MKKINFGRFKIVIDKNNSSKALDVILKNSLSYDSIDFEGNGETVITVHSSLRERYESVFSTEGVNAEFYEKKEIINLLMRYSKRWGLVFGMLLMVICIHLSSRIVWKINIDGNYSISDDEIIDSLNESGLYLGAYIPNIDYDKLHNKFLLISEDISWISVNINGNVANVKVKERMKEEDKESSKYANVVAKCDGQIAMITLYDGIKTVKISDVVKKGDILISGVMDSSSEGVRYVRADGIVKAYVKKNISVKIPMKQQVKMYTGNICSDKNIKVFTKNINIFKKYRNSYEFCDRIEAEKNITLFGICPLPLSVNETRYLEYELNEIIYTKNEARDMALIQLKAEMDSALTNAELISKAVNHYCDFEYYYIECELYCIEDIAEHVEFEVTEE